MGSYLTIYDIIGDIIGVCPHPKIKKMGEGVTPNVMYYQILINACHRPDHVMYTLRNKEMASHESMICLS